MHFYYGSRPKWNARKVEKKQFGGLHDGHVSLQIGDSVFSFRKRGKIHVFPHRKGYHSKWENLPLEIWMKDTAKAKYCTFIIVIPRVQYGLLKEIQSHYSYCDPYDYAYFGMRCASSAYDVLTQIHVLKKRSQESIIIHNFYPQRLRLKLFRASQINHWEVVTHQGSSLRRWESR